MPTLVTFKTVDGYRVAINPQHVRSVSEQTAIQVSIRVGESERYVVKLSLEEALAQLNGTKQAVSE